MCEEYADEEMTAPPHLKNGNYWEMVSSRSGTFLNYVATFDDKHSHHKTSVNSHMRTYLSGSFGR